MIAIGDDRHAQPVMHPRFEPAQDVEQLPLRGVDERTHARRRVDTQRQVDL
jgi:hypothetical protein